jgi:hypothetical protein
MDHDRNLKWFWTLVYANKLLLLRVLFMNESRDYVSYNYRAISEIMLLCFT